MIEPRFTIAIPCYNGEGSIERALKSCLDQKTTSDFEVLVVDNASTDSTPKLLAGFYDRRLRVIRNEDKLCIFGNHNRCLFEAKGEYLIFCHSDDMLADLALERLDGELSRLGYPNKIVVWGYSLIKDYSGCLEAAGLTVGVPFAGMRAQLPFVYGGLTPSGTCYSSRTLKEAGGFIEVDHWLAPADTVVHIHLAISCFQFLMSPSLLFVRRSASTATDAIETADVIDAYSEAFQKLFCHYLTSKQQRDLIKLADSVQKKPAAFWLFLMGTREYRFIGIKKMVKLFFKAPANLFDPLLREFIIRLLKPKLVSVFPAD